jgi:tRNA CCA-adding enzyme
MGNKKFNSVLSEVLVRVNQPISERREIESLTKKFISDLVKKIREKNIKAEIFVGGSFAKKTVIRKDELVLDEQNSYKNPDKRAGLYDVDVFVRFDRSYKEEKISNMTSDLLKGMNFSVVHGSRDYFRIKMSKLFFVELIPVMKVRKPQEARNITDLSYSHVQYVNKKIKSEKILNDIKIAKAFCYANDCYGAESYIKGFSGYGLELLVYYYNGFLNFVKAVGRMNKKEIIDIEKFYRNKQMILMDLNSSKLGSPIVLVDPTYKQRNVLAALSAETFERFRNVCSSFLKSPSISFFERKSVDLPKIKKNAVKSRNDFVVIETRTVKDEGDVAGSKLLKFFKHLESEMKVYFDVQNKGFIYEGGQRAKCFFVARKKKEILHTGPRLNDESNVRKFKKEHKICFTKNGRVYSREKVIFDLNGFFDIWKKRNQKKIREMYIDSLNIVKI